MAVPSVALPFEFNAARYRIASFRVVDWVQVTGGRDILRRNRIGRVRRRGMSLASDKERDGSSLAAVDATDIDLSSTGLCALGSEVILEPTSAVFHMATR